MLYPCGDNEAERLAAVDDLALDQTTLDPILDGLCKVAVDLFRVPVVLVTIVGRDEQSILAKVGTDIERTRRVDAFCNHTILSDDILVVPEARDDPRFALLPGIRGLEAVRFYAGAPLAIDDGLRVGALCLVDDRPRDLSASDRTLLRDLADVVVLRLRLHRATVRERVRAEAIRTGQPAWQTAHQLLAPLARELDLAGPIDVAWVPDGLDTLVANLRGVDRERFMALAARGAIESTAPSEAKPRTVQERSNGLAREEEAFRAALAAEDAVVPFYQPEVRLSTGEIVGFEALARWRHPSRGLISPSDFGSLLHDPVLARALTARILDRVTRDVAAWKEGGLDCGRIAFNVASADFAEADLTGRILAALAAGGCGPSDIEVEVSERTVFDGMLDGVSRELEALRRHGATVALDDFGTGFASLRHLTVLPIDNIKIDRSFVAGIGSDAGDETIVSSVIALARDLGMSVTAEGIETEHQADFLDRHGCEQVQGYWFGRPMEASAVPAFLLRWTARRSLLGPAHAWLRKKRRKAGSR